MAIHLVVATRNPAAVLAQAQRAYGDKVLVLTESTFAVSESGSARDVATKLHFLAENGKNENAPGSAVIGTVSNYHGLAGPDVWEWFREKWEGGVFG